MQKTKLVLWMSVIAMGRCLSQDIEEARLSTTQVLSLRGTAAQLEVAEPVGDSGLVYQWYKDGRVLSGANEQLISFDAMQPGHAGSYHVQVRQGTRQWRSEPTPVVVYEEALTVISKAHYDRPLIVNARVWGPAEIYWRGNNDSWGYPNDDLKDSWCIQGAKDKQLSISHPLAVPRSLAALVSVGYDYAVTEVLSTDTVNDLKKIRPSFINSPRDAVVNVGDSVEVGPRYLGWYDPETQTARVRGLPGGLTFDPASFGVTGIATVSGTYPLTWEIWEKGRLLTQVTSFLIVQDPAKPSTFVHPGLYACEVPPEPIPPGPETNLLISNGGYLELYASLNGSFSGLLRLGTAQWRFSSALKWQDGLLTTILRVPPPPGYQELKITFAREEYLYVAAAVELTRNNDEPVVPYVILRPERDIALVDPLRFRGPFACLLDNYGNDSEVELPCTSFMTLRPAQRLTRLNAVGTMLNGSGFTMSMPVTSEPSDIPMTLQGIFYRPPAKAGEILSGVLNLCVLTGESLPDIPVSGEVVWNPANNQRSQWMPQVTGNSYLHVEGDTAMQPRASTHLLTRLQDTPNAMVTLTLPAGHAQGLDLTEQFFQLTASGRAIFPANKRKFQMDIYPPTGFFTGSFLLGPEAGASGPTRKVRFQGLFVPGLKRGGGFFTMPLPGSTAGKLTSGLLSIEPPRL